MSAHLLSMFIDVFGINQSNVGGDDELPQLANLIQKCGHTVLIFNKWHDPEIVRRGDYFSMYTVDAMLRLCTRQSTSTTASIK